MTTAQPSYEAFRDDLTLMYLPSLAPTGELVGLRMVPMQIRKMQLHRASEADARWLHHVLDEKSRPFGAELALESDHTLSLRTGGRHGVQPGPLPPMG